MAKTTQSGDRVEPVWFYGGLCRRDYSCGCIGEVMETVVMQDDGGDNQRSLRLIVVVGSR